MQSFRAVLIGFVRFYLLFRAGMAKEGIFRVSGSFKEASTLRLRFASGETNIDFSVCIFVIQIKEVMVNT